MTTPQTENQDAQKPQASPIPEEQEVVSGGPVEEIVASEEAVEDPEPEAPVFKWGNREFKTQEELAEFIAELDKKASKNEGYEEAIAKLSAQQQQPAEEPKEEPKDEGLVIDGVRAGEQIWEDPDAALSAVKKAAIEEAKQQFRDEQAQQQAVDAFWGDFYSKNQDLSDMRDHVDMILTKHQKELYALPASEAGERLATLTRGEMKRIREKFSETENLGNSPAVVADPTPAPGAAPVAAETIKDVAFIDQVRQFQSKYF
jgi:hypothetical protein